MAINQYHGMTVEEIMKERSNMTPLTPAQQHAKQAEAILERRKRSPNNDFDGKEPAPKKKTVLEGPKLPDNVASNETTEITNPYEGKSRKQLRMLCDNREPAVKYKKKDTIADLIDLLEG